MDWNKIISQVTSDVTEGYKKLIPKEIEVEHIETKTKVVVTKSAYKPGYEVYFFEPKEAGVPF